MKRFGTLTAATLASLTPALALASGGEGEHGAHGVHDFHLVDMAPSIFNFLILVVVFVWLFRDGVANFLKQRKADIAKALEEAATLKAAAEAKQQEYTARLAKLDAELAQMKQDMLEAGQAERDRIVREAEERAARMRHEAEFLIEQQAKQLRIELTREAVEAAVAAAERMLTQAATPQDQQRLAEEYLAQLKQSAAPQPSLRPSPVAQETRA